MLLDSLTPINVHTAAVRLTYTQRCICSGNAAYTTNAEKGEAQNRHAPQQSNAATWSRSKGSSYQHHEQQRVPTHEHMSRRHHCSQTIQTEHYKRRSLQHMRFVTTRHRLRHARCRNLGNQRHLVRHRLHGRVNHHARITSIRQIGIRHLLGSRTYKELP